MRVKFFSVPALDSSEAEKELNGFLARHRILSIEREIVAEKVGSFWAVGVIYLDRPNQDSPVASPNPSKSRIDYKEVLSPEDFAVYAELRTLRKEVAEREGVPTYAVFNNAQLAEMVQKRMRSSKELEKIVGVGPARLKAHGARFLERLRELQAARPTLDSP